MNVTSDNITLHFVSIISHAYGLANETLFGGSLPPSAIILDSSIKSALGYFQPDVWQIEGQGDSHATIALNPAYFAGRDMREIVSTLIHEMCHLRQHIEGTASRNGYHNKNFAKLMDELGLRVYNVTDPSKQTGQKCTHHIMPEGLYDTWFSLHGAFLGIDKPLFTMPPKGEAKKANKKVCYECSNCGDKVWGKPGMRIVCGDCYVIETGHYSEEMDNATMRQKDADTD